MDLERGTARRLFAGSVMLVGVYFLARGAIALAHLWMLIFGAVVVAVVIRSIADPLVARLKLKDGIAVAIAILAILLLLTGIGLLFGQQISKQVDQLAEFLPGAWEQLRSRLQESPAAQRVFEQLQGLGSEFGRAIAIAPRLAMSTLTALTTPVLVVVAGVFLAVEPGKAREGVLAFTPEGSRERLRDVMNTCGRALNGWAKAQALSMLLVGSIVSLGLWLIGVPAPLALGLFTGLAQFVPILGPIASAVPALLIAATGGSQMFLLTLALFLGVSQLEANLITPLVQKNVASLPVVLGIFAVVGFGTLFGPLGVLFAAPLALVVYTALTMLYRQDVLDAPEAEVPGEER